MQPKIRLQKYLAACGLGSRRACEALIQAGRVRVAGQVVSELGTSIVPGEQPVAVDGRQVQPQTLVYLAMNKPRGVLCTSHDPQGRRTVLDLIRDEPAAGAARLYTIGRLDQNSEGLLLLTNDGALAQQLTHPRYHVEKEYRVWVNQPLAAAAIQQLEAGIEDAGEHLRLAGIKKLPGGPGAHGYAIILREGHKRQIRRMLEAVGLRVQRLQRIRIGPLPLGALRPGAVRPLTPAEIQGLRQAPYPPITGR